MTQQTMETPANVGPWYRAFWRWHFYSGLVVIPFLLMLALSGMLMLLSEPVDRLLNRDLLRVAAAGDPLPPSVLRVAVQSRYPGMLTTLYLPPESQTGAARFVLAPGGDDRHGGHGSANLVVHLDPYTGRTLGTLDPARSLYARIKQFHGTLYLGDAGDALIEIAAGFGVLMVLTGLYLAWPRNGWKALLPARSPARWRSQHRFWGLVLALPLLFFLISGLAWTNVWGGKLVQTWSSLPGTRYDAESAPPHRSMNIHGAHQVPWALEQTPVARAAPGGDGNGGLDLDGAVKIAATQGVDRFRVHLPREDQGVWTLSSTTIAGDITDPSRERVLHLDRHTGEVLADIRLADYPPMGKAMAAFIPLHQGDLGGWNLALNLAFCALVIFMIGAAIAMWWQRRPAGPFTLAPPPAPAGLNRIVVALMGVVALCFPLSAAVIVLFALLDWVLISRVGKAAAVFK